MKMWYMYTVEYYSTVKKNEFMKFVGKWIVLRNIILSRVTKTQKIDTICFLISVALISKSSAMTI